MVKYYNENAHYSEVGLAINSISKSKDIKSLMIFFADDKSLEIEKLNEIFTKQQKTIIGGIFPEIIFNNEKKTSGFFILAFAIDFQTTIIDLDKSEEDIDSATTEFSQQCELDSKTLWVLMDAFSANKNTLINSLYNEFGPNLSYIGGGAGTLSLKSSPCIISNFGVKSNCAILGMMKSESSVGVAHGWLPISEPIKVTETEGNIIKSLEWRNAFDYYFSKIKEHSGKEINKENFFEIAKSYPLGIIKLNSEIIVRDPISTDGNNLFIIDEVPENEFIQILNGDNLSLFKGAAMASRNARNKHYSNSFLFCIDCISRVLFLGEKFNQELNEISDDDEICGILSIGEIANSGNSMLEIFNKTVVVCNFSLKL
jgi:hypothetical protein